ncbi:hypothetical protein [Pedobacter sandarakinus]|uniref:hypothetical protein n=1 Tax=Pedobacter sandarakinus TaxID=353156 RepID=UPI00224724ED|nr:hypothetical protein [Pedobacter sandarakinus]MCX2573582.1 hypothetical protein [Pedobacter sandarakinus]
MNLETYKIYWGEKNEILHVTNLQNSIIKHDTDYFLTFWGLPSNVAPFLNFEDLNNRKLLSANEFFDLNNDLLDSFLVLGTNGAGDPICIDINIDDEIVYLNHDNNFERIYINKDIYKFATSLIHYDQFTSSLIDSSAVNYERKKFTDQAFKELKNDFENIDNTCFAYNSFWTSELDALLLERDND